MPNLKCKICGTEFPALIERHYISRDSTKTGFAAAFGSSDEPTIFDTYDCPNCGCQVIAQPRKRNYKQDYEEVTDEEFLERIDSQTVADHLGIPAKAVEFFRMMKEEGVEVTTNIPMSSKDIYDYMQKNDLKPSETAEKLNISRDRVIQAMDDVFFNNKKKKALLYFDSYEAAKKKARRHPEVSQ